MNEKKIETKTGLVLAIVLIAAVARLIAVPLFGARVNFAPMNAIALFGGAYFVSPLAAFLLPLVAIFASDQILNALYYSNLTASTPFYAGWYWQYIGYLLIAGIGTMLRGRIRPLNVAGASVSSSILFFMVSNFGVWFSMTMYEPTLAGLMVCYAMAIPFFGATLAGDLFYSALMFGSAEAAVASQRRTAPVSVSEKKLPLAA